MKFLCIYRTLMLFWHWLSSKSLFKQHVWCFLVPLCVMYKQDLYKDEVVPHIVVRHLLCFEYVCCRRDYSEIRWGGWTWIDMPFLSSASVVNLWESPYAGMSCPISYTIVPTGLKERVEKIIASYILGFKFWPKFLRISSVVYVHGRTKQPQPKGMNSSFVLGIHWFDCWVLR